MKIARKLIQTQIPLPLYAASNRRDRAMVDNCFQPGGGLFYFEMISCRVMLSEVLNLLNISQVVALVTQNYIWIYAKSLKNIVINKINQHVYGRLKEN
jgi:hypothetical protein